MLSVHITKGQVYVEPLGNAVCVREGRRRARAKRDAHLGPGSCVENVTERKRLHRHGCRNVEKPVKGWDVGEQALYAQREASAVCGAQSAPEPLDAMQVWGHQQTELSLCAWRFTARNRSYSEQAIYFKLETTYREAAVRPPSGQSQNFPSERLHS